MTSSVSRNRASEPTALPNPVTGSNALPIRSEATETAHLTPQATADRELAMAYASTLRRYASELPTTPSAAEVMPNIPPTALFGQWRAHLYEVLQLPALRSWLSENGIDPSQGFSFWPSNGRLAQRKADGSETTLYGLAARKTIPEEWNLLLGVTKVLVPGNQAIVIHPDINQVSVREVGLFHGHDWTSHPTKALLEQRALDLENNGGLGPGDARGNAGLDSQKLKLEALTHRALPSAQMPQSRDEGDSALAILYAKALLKGAASQPFKSPQAQIIESIPPGSTFGQWNAHLHTLLNSAPFNGWASAQGIDRTRDITINLPQGNVPGTITCTVKGTAKTFGSADEEEPLPAGWSLIMKAARVLAAGSPSLVSPTSASRSPLSVIGNFYGQPVATTKAALEEQAAALNTDKSFVDIDDDDFVRHPAPRAEQRLQTAREDLSEIIENHTASTQLASVMRKQDQLSQSLSARTQLPVSHHDHLDPAQVERQLKDSLSQALKTTTLTLSSSMPGRAPVTLSLHDYIAHRGWLQPQSNDELVEFLRFLHLKPLTVPVSGSFSGLLSNGEPLSGKDHADLETALKTQNLGLPGVRGYDPATGVLGYLSAGVRVGAYQQSIGVGNLPRGRVEEGFNALLKSPKAQAFGLALQGKFSGVSNTASVKDWILTALAMDLHRPTTTYAGARQILGQTVISNGANIPARTTVAGYDLAQPAHWGLHPSKILDKLDIHLYFEKKEPVSLAAHALLARKAPAFLVNNIPAIVTYGSHAWANLVIAVARIEARAPGATSHMNYVDVMAYNDIAPLTAADKLIEQEARQDALKDWGVAQGVIAYNPGDKYTDQQMNTVTQTFKKHLTELKAASTALREPPPSRKELALAELTKLYGPDIPFEEKCITLSYYRAGYKGPYSVLDLYMQNRLVHHSGVVSTVPVDQSKASSRTKPTYWQSSNPKVDILKLQRRANKLPYIDSVFYPPFAEHKKRLEENLPVLTKYLISNLPLEDRRQLEFGKLSLFSQTKVYNNPDRTAADTRHPNPNIVLIKTELGPTTKVYEYNVSTRAISLRPELEKMKQGKQDIYELETFDYQPITPPDDAPAGIMDERQASGAVPQNYFSNRTSFISSMVLQESYLNLLKSIGRGATTFETEIHWDKIAYEAALNLIPFRSAIMNFAEGNIGEGLKDLLFDAFSLITIVAGTPATSALSKSASAFTKLRTATRVVGRVLWEMTNPLEFATIASKAAYKNGKRLLGIASNYDLVKASARFPAAATGTYKSLDEVIETSAVFHNGQWFRYDPINMKPYGKPLAAFDPKSIAMGGNIEEIKRLDEGIFMTVDKHNNNKRLTLDVHGARKDGHDAALMMINGKELTAHEAFEHLKNCGVKFDQYDEIRLTMCHSADGDERSFAASFAKLTKKPVKSYQGTMYIHPNVESLSINNFQNRRELRDHLDTFVGKPRPVQRKHVEIGVQESGATVFKPDPSYQPVYFSAEGVKQPGKTRTSRAPTQSELDKLAELQQQIQKRHSQSAEPTPDYPSDDDYDLKR